MATAAGSPRPCSQEVERLAAELEGRGRVLVRPSGTEPLVRVIVEAENADEAADLCGSSRRRSIRAAASTSSSDLRPSRESEDAAESTPTPRPAGTTKERRRCAGSSDTWGRGSASTSSSPASSGSSTAATTPPASRCSRRTASTYTRAVGNLQNLKVAAGDERARRRRPASATRAGRPTAASPTENAHPLAVEDAAELSIVLNGIVENYRELREPPDRGAATSSPPRPTPRGRRHLIEEHYDGDLVEATRARVQRARGPLRLRRDPPRPPGPPRRRAPPVPARRRRRRGRDLPRLDATAFLRETREVQFPEDGEIVAITPGGAAFLRADGRQLRRARARTSSTGTTRAPRRAASRPSC